MEYTLIIERGKDNIFVGSVVELPGCYSEGDSLDELLINIKEAIKLYLEAEQPTRESEFVGIQRLIV
ncbi:hypothetical protein A3F66_02605 [candidate division TM6 bacterium RIFCSPHIGHO2_12_FULL_32_22]|nr:MAG: hypothetical protein A3F66_02605 [candidate division TM6 bacterium RIFCSPHIGHO2_12_FULL_32_22]